MMSNRRIIYYYQTIAGGITQILRPEPLVTHIHLSAVHFGYNTDGTPYIHLNDTPIDDPSYGELWHQLYEAARLGIRVVLMVGGAGGAYQALFSDFNTFYPMLRDAVKSRSFITGIDLDIEEPVQLSDVKMLIDRIHTDFPYNILSMAPIQSSLQTNNPGLGGFVYKDLFNSPEGQYITYFNGQFYVDYSVNAYDQCIQNGYPADKIVMGMMSSQFENDFTPAYEVISTLSDKYPNFGGAYNWEYYDSPPGGTTNPQIWSEQIKKAMDYYTNTRWWFW